MGSLIRAVILLVLLVAVVVGVGAFFLGYRVSDLRGEPASVGTTGTESAAGTARERGAEIGAQVGAAADRAGEMASDATLTARIKSKMALDDLTEARDINVSTSDRVVTLTGTVSSRAERERAVQLARETAGVKSVNDKLTIAGR